MREERRKKEQERRKTQEDGRQGLKQIVGKVADLYRNQRSSGKGNKAQGLESFRVGCWCEVLRGASIS